MIKDKFIRGSALLFTAMIVGCIFGYFFQLAMGRMLTVEAYGELNALMSFLVLFGIPFGALINFFAREAAVFSSLGSLDGIKGLHNYGLKKTYIIMVPISCFMCILSPIIGNYIDVSIDKVLLIIMCVFTTAIVTVNTGIIQGMQYFRSLSFISAGTHIFKFLFAVIFVLFGWGVRGSLGGLVVAGFILWGLSQWLLLSNLPNNNTPFSISYKKLFNYVGGVFLANLFFAIMTQADVVLIKHYFTSQEAGLYASASIMGKAVMYIPSAIVMAFYPMVAANQAAGRSSRKILSKALCLTFLISGFGSIVLFLFAEYFMGNLFGQRYLAAAPITALFGFVMLPMALLLLLMNFFIAQGETRFVWFLAITTILELAGIHFFRENIHAILYVIMVAGYLALLPMIISVFKKYQ